MLIHLVKDGAKRFRLCLYMIIIDYIYMSIQCIDISIYIYIYNYRCCLSSQSSSDISHQNAQDTHSPTKISASCCGWPIRPHKAVGSVASLHAKCRLGHSPGWAACTMARLQDPKRSGDGWGQILAHIISYPYTYPYTYPYMVEYTGCK